MQAISDHVGSYQGITYCGLTKWTNKDLFLSFAYNFKNVVVNVGLLVVPAINIAPIISTVIQKLLMIASINVCNIRNAKVEKYVASINALSQNVLKMRIAIKESIVLVKLGFAFL